MSWCLAAQQKVTGAIAKSTEAMETMNKLMKVNEISETMQAMQQEMMKVRMPREPRRRRPRPRVACCAAADQERVSPVARASRRPA